jgi:hypothetical protein
MSQWENEDITKNEMAEKRNAYKFFFGLLVSVVLVFIL